MEHVPIPALICGIAVHVEMPALREKTALTESAHVREAYHSAMDGVPILAVMN